MNCALACQIRPFISIRAAGAGGSVRCYGRRRRIKVWAQVTVNGLPY